MRVLPSLSSSSLPSLAPPPPRFFAVAHRAVAPAEDEASPAHAAPHFTDVQHLELEIKVGKTMEEEEEEQEHEHERTSSKGEGAHAGFCNGNNGGRAAVTQASFVDNGVNGDRGARVLAQLSHAPDSWEADARWVTRPSAAVSVVAGSSVMASEPYCR